MSNESIASHADALPDRLAPSWLWWLMTLAAVGVGLYAMTLQDARPQRDLVPGLPWIDELHFFFGGLSLCVGPFAFRRDILARATAWHHRVGWLYVLCVVLSGAAALTMACFSIGGITTHLGFGGLAVCWLTTTLLGVRAIKDRRVRDHRRWMVLSFALCFAAVTLRIQLGPLAYGFGSFEAGYRVVSWSCWVPNLCFALWWLGRTDVSGQRRRAPQSR